METQSINFFKPIREILLVVHEAYGGMTVRQFGILLEIADNEGVTSLELAKRMKMNTSSIYRNLGTLSIGVKKTHGGTRESKGLGLVDMRPDLSDTRRMLLYLSAEGHALLSKLTKNVRLICQASS
jgi:DNA-binding MarR family transcriptional regulator